MAYLDNTVITVDAVLTKLGRERLSQGLFDIKKWAVSDDEVDYSLYNTAHPLGSDYYANIIESMPVLEAIPDETQALRYKLYTGNNENLPVLTGATPGDTIIAAGTPGSYPNSLTITPDTSPNVDENYVITLFNEDAATLSGTFTMEPLADVNLRANTTGITLTSAFTPGGARNLTGTLVRTLAGGSTLTVTAKPLTSAITTKIRVTGETTGVTKTFSFTVNPTQTSQTS